MRYQISEYLYEKELGDLARADDTTKYFMIMTLFSSFFALELNLLGASIEVVYIDNDFVLLDVETTTSLITTSTNRYEINPPSNILNKWVENYDIQGESINDLTQNLNVSGLQNYSVIDKLVNSNETVQCFATNSTFFAKVKKYILEQVFYIYEKVYNPYIASIATQRLKKELVAKNSSIDRLLSDNSNKSDSARNSLPATVIVPIFFISYKKRFSTNRKQLITAIGSSSILFRLQNISLHTSNLLLKNYSYNRKIVITWFWCFGYGGWELSYPNIYHST